MLISNIRWSLGTSSGTASGLPVKGKYNITGGYPNYAGAGGSEHYGNDFQTVGAQESGDLSNVYSVVDGTVVAKTSDSIEGNYVVIKNSDWAFSYYGHAPSQSAIVVNVGDKVKKGQHISHQGQTGLATGVLMFILLSIRNKIRLPLDRMA